MNTIQHDSNRYSRIAVALHWLLAVLLLYQLALGWWMIGLPKSMPELRTAWFNWHKSVGIVIALLVLLRLSWRAAHPGPDHAALPAWQRRATRLSHMALYVCMLLLPLSGFVGSVFSGHAVKFFGIVLPLSYAWPAARQLMSGLHFATVCLFMALVALHVAAAVWHWSRRDGIASRMGLPEGSRG